MIELKVHKFEDGIVTFYISRQDKEDYKILKEERYVCLDNGKIYSLQSCRHPTLDIKKLFVRGLSKERDETLLRTDFCDYLNIFECIKKYNKEFC